MEEALQLLSKSPEVVIPSLLKDVGSRGEIVKKVRKLMNKGKISPNLVLKAKGQSRKTNSPRKKVAKDTAVWRLTAEIFDDYEKLIETYKTQNSAINAAWKFVNDNLVDDLGLDVDEAEFRNELKSEGSWMYQEDMVDVVIDLHEEKLK